MRDPRERFTAAERRLIARLRTPEQVQAWLYALPYNWERRGETLRTFRGVVRRKRAHCLEAAVTAAAILEQHGFPPLLLDIESEDRLDHVVFLFQRDGKWGTVGRSREPGLHGRKPVFADIESLVRSYMPPFIDATGRVKGYGTYDLRRMDKAGRDWRFRSGNSWFIQDTLIHMRHTRLATPEAEYRRWKSRFDRFKREHPRSKPTYFDDTATWMVGAG